MNITSYVKKFGDRTFDEHPFNDVDALIMAELSYVNWDLLVPSIHDGPSNGFLFKDVPLSRSKELYQGEFDFIFIKKLFSIMSKSKRYRKTRVRFYEKHDSAEALQQFFAITFTMENGHNVISFRGTDLSLKGWKEDAALSFMDKIPSQSLAKGYVARAMDLIKGPVTLVGHSKGGNLSVYSAMKMSPQNKRRLVYAYSFDGPGFKNKEVYESRQFLSVKKKIKKFVPYDSIVGVLLNHDDLGVIVDSNLISVFQHDLFAWKIKNDHEIKPAKKRMVTSKINEQTLVNFLDGLSLEERQETTNAIFDLLGKPEGSLADIPMHMPTTIKHFTKTFMGYSKQDRKKLISMAFKLIDSYRRAVWSELGGKKNWY